MSTADREALVKIAVAEILDHPSASMPALDDFKSVNVDDVKDATAIAERVVDALRVVEVLAMVAPIIERSKDQIGTHSPNCHEHHVACLAVAVRHRLGVSS